MKNEQNIYSTVYTNLAFIILGLFEALFEVAEIRAFKISLSVYVNVFTLQSCQKTSEN